MKLREIAKRDWSWILYEYDESYILTVMCGTTAMYPINIRLSESQVALVKRDESYVDEIAMSVFKNPSRFWPENIEISDEDR